MEDLFSGTPRKVSKIFFEEILGKIGGISEKKVKKVLEEFLEEHMKEIL